MRGWVVGDESYFVDVVRGPQIQGWHPSWDQGMPFLTSTYQAFFAIMLLRGADNKDEDDVLERSGVMVFLTCGIPPQMPRTRPGASARD
jgi:hypothetical protein